jgi:GT2 family glycosyltransferase
MEIVDGTLADLVAEMDRRPEVGVGSAVTHYPDGTLHATIRRFPSPTRQLGEALLLNRLSALRWLQEEEMRLDAYETEQSADWLVGGFLIVRREAFEQAGGFEPSFATGFEDFDFCQRLHELGHRIVYAPTPRVVVHETPAARREALDVVDRALFVDRWYDRLSKGDPFFNPNFERTQASFVPKQEVLG